MATCYQCGRSVPADAGYRREVYTGCSRGNSIGVWNRHLSYQVSRRRYYGVRTLCPWCAGVVRPLPGSGRLSLAGPASGTEKFIAWGTLLGMVAIILYALV